MGEVGAVAEEGDEVGAEEDMQIIKKMVDIQTGALVVVVVVTAIVVLDMEEGGAVAEAMAVDVAAWAHVQGVVVTSLKKMNR